MGTHLMRNTTVALAASAFLGGCTQFTGSDDVSLDGDPISHDDGPGAIVPLPASPELSCAYPTAPVFGPAMGQTLGAQLSWMGYPASEDVARQFPVSELYDCTTEEIHAIIFDTSQFN